MATLAMLACGTARAQELIFMPYRCAVYDGRPVLTPTAEDQGHRIVSTREQRTITTCSPVDPGLCRQWSLHRFEIDCGGVPVAWTSVLAAAYPDRVRADGGQLQIRMPPRWTMAPDDPCARTYAYEGGWRPGRYDRYCADRRALAPPPYVTMPVGFAPLLGMNAVFVAARTAGLRPAPAGNAGPDPMARAPAPGPGPEALPAPPAPPKKTVATAPPVKETPKAAEPAPKPVPALPPVAADPTPPQEQAPPQANAAPAPGAPGTVVVPKIINREGAGNTPPARVETPPPKAPVAPSTPITVETTAVAPAGFGPQPKAASGLALLLAKPEAPLALAVAALCSVALLAGFAAWRLRRRPDFVGPERDISNISFGGDRRGDVVVSQWRAPARATPPPLPPDIGLGDRMPESRDDALRVLGMGVMPGATGAALKKIIDGLRQAWHPDLAQDENDRLLRELRMKQINAAWDILSPKPSRGPAA
ncbi:MAG: hypothetical protein EKK41_12865 [Hyphomicrobiales bacterium]|nr:MAG: hypothetical protein EKK41_12865 [Hyphomicrobiales bacterium]